MMRQSETMRAASRLLLSHPIVCLLAVLAAGVVLGVLGPIKVVHATDVAPVEAENFDNKPSGGGGSLTYIGSATGNTGTKPQVKVTVPVPPGTKQGDFMLALLQADYGNVGGTLPSGWALINDRRHSAGMWKPQRRQRPALPFPIQIDRILKRFSDSSF